APDRVQRSRGRSRPDRRVVRALEARRPPLSRLPRLERPRSDRAPLRRHRALRPTLERGADRRPGADRGGPVLPLPAAAVFPADRPRRRTGPMRARTLLLALL